MNVNYQNATAYYYGYPYLKLPNATEYLTGVFSVKAGANAINRPIGGGVVGFGSLKDGASRNATLAL